MHLVFTTNWGQRVLKKMITILKMLNHQCISFLDILRKQQQISRSTTKQIALEMSDK